MKKLRAALAMLSADTDFDWTLPSACLKAYAHSRPGLGPEDADISLHEWVQWNTPARKAARELARRDPHIAGFTCYASNIAAVGKVVKELRRLSPKTRIALGGPEVSADPKGWLERLPADFAAVGEGEGTFAELLTRLREGGGGEGVRGLAFRDGSRVVVNPMRPPLDPGELRSPYLSGTLVPDPSRRECFVFETARGCPFDCAFCYWPGKGGKVRYFSDERVRAEIRVIAAQASGVRLCLADADLFLNKERAKRVLRIFNEEDPDARLHFEFLTNPGNLDDELARLSDRRGLNFTAGLQSTNPAVFRAAKRRSDLPRFTRGVRLLRERAPKAQIGIELILGMPGDTLEGYRRTLEWVLDHDFDYCRAFHLMVLPGTYFIEDAERFGLEWTETPPYLAKASATFPERDMAAARRTVYETSFLMNLWPVREVLTALRAKGRRGPCAVDLCALLVRRLQSRGIHDFDGEFSRLESGPQNERIPFIERPEERLSRAGQAAVYAQTRSWLDSRKGVPARLRGALRRILDIGRARALWAGAAWAEAVAPHIEGREGRLLCCWARDLQEHMRLGSMDALVLLSEDGRDLWPARDAPLPIRETFRVRGRKKARPRPEAWGNGFSLALFSNTFSFLPNGRWLRELRKRCAPGARLVITDDLLGWHPLRSVAGDAAPGKDAALKSALRRLRAGGWKPVVAPRWAGRGTVDFVTIVAEAA